MQLGIVQHALGLFEGGARGGNILGAVLGLPGEALPHYLDGHQFGEAVEEQALARGAAALDELDHAELEPMAETAHGQAPGRRALALAGSGVDDQEALLACLAGVEPVLGRLDPGHLVAVLGLRVRRLLNHAFRSPHGASALAPSSSSRATALLRRGCHRPRSIASANRCAISRSAAGLTSATKPRTASSPR